MTSTENKTSDGAGLSRALTDASFVVPFKNFTYLEIINLFSLIGLNLHPVAHPGAVIDALPQNLRADHVQNEIFFCDLDNGPGRLACLPVAFFHNGIQ